MDGKILLLLLLFLFLIFNKKKYDMEQFSSVSVKDWLEEIFDYRQIITIPSRLQHVKKFCKTFEVKPIIFNAILKKDISYNNIHGLKIGEIACTLSQEQVLKNFIKTKHSSLLMLEDDNIPFTDQLYVTSGLKIKHVKKYISNAFKSLPYDWDILYLGRCWDDCAKNIKINKYLYKTHRTLCHHAIAFSRNGAKKVLQAIKHPINLPIDHIVANLVVKGVIDAYASAVPIFYQNRDELSSTIGNFDNLPICM
jgi:GR25 family glycosyltransferase involved in LPS biosynthesis